MGPAQASGITFTGAFGLAVFRPQSIRWNWLSQLLFPRLLRLENEQFTTDRTLENQIIFNNLENLIAK